MSEDQQVEEKERPSVAAVAWTIVQAIVVMILICLIFGAFAMVAWNALTSATGLEEINLREAAAAVLLFRTAVLITRV